MSRQSRTNAGTSKAEYGNWVPRRLVYVPALVGAGFLVLSLWLLALAIIAIISFVVSGYFLYARYLLAPQGKDIQRSVWTTLLSHLEWDGRGSALDIGSGSGALSILLAQTYPEATVTGIDRWGEQWEYSKSLCDRNAAVEGVGSRVTFQQASASSLPFPDESFDVVVSNLTFHEVRDVADKRQLIREALRVLRRNGKFVFQDLFLLKRSYGDVPALLDSIRGWGAKHAEFVETGNSPFVPGPLRLPFMLGTMGVLKGEK